ncbi:MAG TPA: glycosyltransferase [Bryobacteraceae bacterium]|nr:glycosyltransferase [Bryobacteraceae bacterium]
MQFLKRLIRSLPLLLVSPVLVAVSALALALTDLFWLLFGKPLAGESARPSTGSASVVIPNWNGRDLLEKYLPSVIEALAGNPQNEIVVVDNGSADGSAEFVRARFPQVKLVALERNLGFGGGSNAGFKEARNDVVVLLNSDMRVAPDFLAPLLEGFRDPDVFAVSCQIFFSDPKKVREETGLTQGWWEDGGLRVRHRIDPAIVDLYPCFYGGGGSCAFDRRRFLELGGFDHLLRPFYLEDTDLGYLAWKRGWKVLYQPRSVVFHEHRGTIGKRFREERIQAVLKKNFLLFAWKNVHEWGRLASHFFFAWAGAIVSLIFGDASGRPNLAALWRAFLQLPEAVRSRWRARSLARIGDTEALLRPLGGYYRDRFADIPALADSLANRGPAPLRVLFVSPYPICPPVHGGGVFMYQTLRELARLAEVHVVELLDLPEEQAANAELRQFCASVEWIIRPNGKPKDWGSLLPRAVREFANDDVAWLIHRQIYTKQIDILQLEYLPMVQYAGEYRRIVRALFEHDVYFQSIARGLGHFSTFLGEVKARVEYLRALRYELRALPRCDQVQVCTTENRDYVLTFLPSLRPRLRAGMRAGIDTSRYEFRLVNRQPLTMLFVGSFRHDPNRIAVDWFVKHVLPPILERQPAARLVIAGSDPPPPHIYGKASGNIEMLGYVEDVREPLARYAVFVCPILSGSGVRVKLLEAFAAGIPVVSTSVGAEGLACKDGHVCALADDPPAFAERVLALFAQPDRAAEMARRARAEVEANWDMARITARLVQSYREALAEKRGGLQAPAGASE